MANTATQVSCRVFKTKGASVSANYSGHSGVDVTADGGFDYVGRESQMRSIRDVKGNMYVFASKNDRYHAEDWDKLYPEDELKQIAHLVQVGEETKVDYAWSVHIGKGGFFNGASSDPDSGTKYEKYLENVEKLEVLFSSSKMWGCATSISSMTTITAAPTRMWWLYSTP